MKAKLEAVSGTLRLRGRALLDRYDAEDLHQLRVGLRRMRGFLKPRKGGRATDLRHELGVLADTTNAARDWDTLLMRAHEELGPRQLGLFEQDVQNRQIEARRPVLQMLRDTRWTGALDSWEKYLKKHPPRKHETGKGSESIEHLRARVDLAWQRANEVGEPRNWHKLRIAIKDLRYRLEAQPGKSATADRSQMLRQCKALQAYLGDWHDTVVHVQLVRELAQRYDPRLQSRKLTVLRNWCRTMERQGRACLEATRSGLESGATAILPDSDRRSPD